ncbi:hypothetical protein PIB30_073046 [Stylosanthes scabra]|uniref:Uncharacterized protein n=1 Tax=Stylosanthes scabra TaxID=79078 RepID=A0ABU6VRS7_9FABA|nr:hypothetical protein [Stylosanthes scabra]
MMEFASEDRPVDRTYQNGKRIIPRKAQKDGGSDWQDIILRDGGSSIALKTLKRVQKGWGQGSISSLRPQQDDFLDHYDGRLECKILFLDYMAPEIKSLVV